MAFLKAKRSILRHRLLGWLAFLKAKRADYANPLPLVVKLTEKVAMRAVPGVNIAVRTVPIVTFFLPGV